MKKLDEAKKLFEAAKSRHLEELLSLKQRLRDEGVFDKVSNVYEDELRILKYTFEDIEEEFKELQSKFTNKKVNLLLELLEPLAHRKMVEDDIRSKMQGLNYLSQKDSEEIIQEYDGVTVPLFDVYEKSYNKIKSLSDLGREEKKVRLSESFTVGNRKVTVNIKNEVDFYDEYYVPIHKKINRYADEIIEAVGAKERKRIERLQVLSKDGIKQVVLRQFKNTVRKVIEKNPRLLRSSNTTINVVLGTERSKGTFNHFKSNFSNIFINITLTDSMLYSVVESSKEYFDETVPVWDTLVHELTHARDWNKGISDDGLEETLSIFGPSFNPKDALCTMILKYSRQEGVAHLSEFLRPKLNPSQPLDITRFVEGYGSVLNKVKNTVQKYDYRESGVIPLSQANSLYGTGTIHTYGTFLAVLLFLNDTKTVSNLILTSDKENVITAFEEDDTYENIESAEVVTLSKVHKLFDEVQNSNMYLVVWPEEGFSSRCQQTMNKLSLMDVEQFLSSAIRTQNKLGFDRSILDKRTVFKRLDRRSLAARIKDRFSGWLS